MFETSSRYASIETTTATHPDGRVITHVRRRFLPQGNEQPLLAEVTVEPGDRLDLITARTLGDPEQFWRVCDGNDAMRPGELTDETGRVIRVTVPQF